jgi:hypothetical protein
MQETTKRDLDAALNKLLNCDFAEMTPFEFAIYTEGYSKSDSSTNSFHQKIMLAKVSDSICKSVEEFERAVKLAANQIDKTTNRLFWATIALVGVTFLLALATAYLAYKA